MMIADGGGGSGVFPGSDIPGVDDFDGGDGDAAEDLTMDLDLFFDILEEAAADPSSSQINPNDLLHRNLEVETATDLGNFQRQSGFQMFGGQHASESELITPATICSSHNRDALEAESSVDPLDYGRSSAMASADVKMEYSKFNSSLRTCSGSLGEWQVPFSKDHGTERDVVLQSGIPSCSDLPTPANISDSSGGVNMNVLLGESGGQLREISRKNEVKVADASLGLYMGSSDGKFGNGGSLTENGLRMPATQIDSSSDDSCFDCLPNFGEDFIFDLFPSSEVNITNIDNLGELRSESAGSASEISMFDYPDTMGLNITNEASNSVSPVGGNFLDGKSSGIPFTCIRSAINKTEQDDKTGEVVSMIYHPDGMTHEAVNRIISCSDESNLVQEESRHSFSGVSSSLLSQKNSVCLKDVKRERDKISASRRAQIEGNGKIRLGGVHVNINAPQQHFSRVKESNIYKKQKISIKDERNSNLILPKSLDISQPARLNQPVALVKANASLQSSAYGESVNYNVVGSTRHRGDDERLIFRAALQDLSQPKTEAHPPEGVLAVPLLRHQRIALSWMVQKETSSTYCSGGILADDQGLGKTISTIALILKERPQLVKTNTQVVKKEEFETLNLDDDDDDDEVTEVDTMGNGSDSYQAMRYLCPSERTNSFGQSKGRPSAGTLVVCPTSVLRQWADELNKKVTREANLSVLVYHGSNRTKDPCELAKYDVVLTTYSIVSMEVPKQPLVGEDDEEKEKVEGDDVASLGLSSGKKRKYPPSCGKKGAKNKKSMDAAALLESVARPLAKVAWFRVVLDEAQSIKNHRTQVARACWGLRAKRRWCLSGTPIQNAIDDLYSYFRFLRYDPYAVYNSFCSTIKVPIQKNPTKGYKKLQAVLKTIMLRRTKATKLDGEPIINLPPKTIELRKVDFTDEERDFYTRLEADSRDQFREYAAAGTVKQNYVNILLMLLRLRQACDHPLLVKGIGSNALGKSSIEIAKKLAREKQMDLLNCLEASLALCGICNDSPEDAVVSLCGHVFCNQCISERLTGDENQCANSKCKYRLNKSSVFSKETLKSSLSGQPAEDVSGSEITTAVNRNSEGLSFNSSKIRAALEVLQSLAPPKDCTSTIGSLDISLDVNARVSPESSCNSGNSVKDGSGSEVLNVNDNVKVVGEKAIVFSQWTKMLDLLEACLKSSSIQYRRLDGTMSVVARDKAVKDFNTLPEVTVMIMSLKAASLGLNMVAACRVLLLDLWWNPTTEDQAIDRAHRIGQTRPVTVLRLTVKDTVEDRILALQQKKREMVASAFGEDETGGRQTRLTVEDLNYLFMV
ncbi:SNF2 domain-containing protein / helicase domain-containing protein / zinc finger protein-related [Euphorbia peplus]|nr:SNF2 domain-containing protein / helicase domain-containing protein / zinc finger protein-related [Euphorbia peplus]